MAVLEHPAPPRPITNRNQHGQRLKTTQERVLSRRAVMWLGQTCNLRCYFCYFLNRIADSSHPEHAFMTVDKCKEMCRIFREVYGCTSIDIQGGEPTIMPGILDLIAYCREIGLYPTLITNGLHLAKPGVLETFKEAGVRDFLVSLHGIGKIHDEVVCRKGSYEKITAAIQRMGELDIPFRYNCTMSKPVVPILPQIAQKAIDYGADAVNFIAFNPFEDQETGIRTHDNVSKYADVKPWLTEALDMLEAAGIESNVRYLPLCMAEERHRKHFYNMQQLPYDHHEWDYQSWLWSGQQPQRMREGGLVPPFKMGRGARVVLNNAHAWRDFGEKHPAATFVVLKAQHAYAALQQKWYGKEAMFHHEGMIRAVYDCKYQKHDACQRCAARDICDGFHGDYAELYGTEEATAIAGERITDPTHYIREQVKIVQREDEVWALPATGTSKK